MPVKLGRQFNRPVTALVPSEAQILQIKIDSSLVKQIDGLSCGYNRQLNIGAVPVDAQTALANTFLQGRIAVFGDDVDLTAFTPAELLGGFHPFASVILFGTDFSPGNILFDRNIVNTYNEDFAKPIIVPDGTSLTILLSAAYAISDAGINVAASIKVSWLNVRGQTYSGEGVRFPYLLR